MKRSPTKMNLFTDASVNVPVHSTRRQYVQQEQLELRECGVCTLFKLE